METVKVRKAKSRTSSQIEITSRSQEKLFLLLPSSDAPHPSLPKLQHRFRPEQSPMTDSTLRRGRRHVDRLLSDPDSQSFLSNRTKGSSTATHRTSTEKGEGRRFVEALPSRKSRGLKKGGEGLPIDSERCSGRKRVRWSKEGSRTPELELRRRRDSKSVDQLLEEIAGPGRRRNSNHPPRFPKPSEDDGI